MRFAVLFSFVFVPLVALAGGGLGGDNGDILQPAPPPPRQPESTGVISPITGAAGAGLSFIKGLQGGSQANGGGQGGPPTSEDGSDNASDEFKAGRTAPRPPSYPGPNGTVVTPEDEDYDPKIAETVPKETAGDWSRIGDLSNQGKQEQALVAAEGALARHPDDPALRAFVELNKRRQAGVDGKAVKNRIEELKAGLREDSGEEIMASPIAFGAASAAGGGAAAGVRGALTAVPDLKQAAFERDIRRTIGLGDLKGAEAALTRRLEAAPGDGGALRLRALVRRGLGRYAESAEDARGALAVNPKDTRAAHLLSRDLTDLGRPREGVVEAERVLAWNPSDAFAYEARGHARKALGLLDDALADFSSAATLDAEFDALYKKELAAAGRLPAPSRRSWPVWLGAAGTALLFFSFVIFRKRGDSSVRLAMRADDHAALAVAPKHEAVPKGFRVVKTLGQGGMGVVYEAVDLGLQRTVALKKLRPEIADNARERGRFLKEARVVAALKHPHIVEIHAIHEDAEGLFLVFERVPGESLADRLARGPLAPAEAVALLRQAASALDYAHAQGVVHQDLKPANMMVAGASLKVMDFGIARRVLDTLSTMSRAEVAGTPTYMAPEQEQGVVTPAADLFALGGSAYEMLAGKPPYPTGGLMLKAQKMYRPLAELRPDLPKAADAALARALEPDPKLRWASASAFVDELARSLS